MPNDSALADIFFSVSWQAVSKASALQYEDHPNPASHAFPVSLTVVPTAWPRPSAIPLCSGEAARSGRLRFLGAARGWRRDGGGRRSRGGGRDLAGGASRWGER
ncbi:hypothetical protein GUJ93_ZPchr0068g2939 [Zizania palustris]|uniref:Uncharacterized protein n=1 Tax=Zizania palustris TaxID=103762 RepID=A0A8J5VEP9_ZIZPA|nr:hypothetical protein GUJ93_ZPchr0068g2939 [Zizania palustris]